MEDFCSGPQFPHLFQLRWFPSLFSYFQLLNTLMSSTLNAHILTPPTHWVSLPFLTLSQALSHSPALSPSQNIYVCMFWSHSSDLILFENHMVVAKMCHRCCVYRCSKDCQLPSQYALVPSSLVLEFLFDLINAPN